MFNTCKYLSIIAILLAGSGRLFSQSSTAEEGKEATLKPRIGVGAGVFTYLGDVKDDYYGGVLSSSHGFELNFARNLSKNFDIELRVVYGNIKVNPRTEHQDYNFRSIVWNGSANLVYNFSHFYKKPRIIKPFVSAGIAYLSFDSKTDRYNASGQEYFYWSDGSIRNLAETDELSATATRITRDYEYETDLRQMNLDGLGKYNRSAISIPGAVGVDFKISPRAHLRVSSTYFYNFTDLVDNISDAGVGERKGNSAPDNFLFHSFALSYNLWRYKPPHEEYYKNIEFDGLLNEDDDSDGTIDIDDMCAGTPKGVKVDADGCPVDGDEDGVPDYLDKELKTPRGQIVDGDGVAINFQKLYENADDTITALKRELLSDKQTKALPEGQKKFTVHVGTFTNKIPDELKQVLRSIKGLRENRINDTLTVFTVGDYDNFDDAEKLTQSLRKKGVDEAFGVKGDFVNDIATELDQLAKGALNTKYLYFRVEFDEYREKVPFDKISGQIAAHGIEVRESTGGLKTYSMGKFGDFFTADDVMQELKKLGVQEPRVIPYLNGKRITIEEALDLFDNEK